MDQRESNYEETQRAIASQKSYIGPAVIVFILYWVFWLPGIIFNLMWLGEARKTQKLTGVQPGGVGCLWIMLILGLAPFIIFILLCLSIAGITATAPQPSPEIVPQSERKSLPEEQQEQEFRDRLEALQKQTSNPESETELADLTASVEQQHQELLARKEALEDKIASATVRTWGLNENQLGETAPPNDSPAQRQAAFTTIKALVTIRQTLNRAIAIEASANALDNEAARYLQVKFNNFPVTNPINGQTKTFSWERDGALAAEEIKALANQVRAQASPLHEEATNRLAQHGTTPQNVNQKIEELWNTIDPSGTTRELYQSAFATITNKEFKGRTYSGDNPDDDIVFTIQTTNNTGRAIEAIEGQWDIKDRLGNPLLLITGTTNGPIPPGQTLESNILLDYNPYDNDDQALKATDLDRLSITYHPRAIAFMDGTTITRPIERDWE